MVRRYVVLVPLLFLVTTFAGLSQGVTTGSLAGTVSVRAGTKPGALPGATVKAIHEPTGSVYGAISRENGRYTIKGMRPGGPYTIRATFVGYEARVVSGVTIVVGETFDLDLALDELGTKTKEVVVTARGDALFDASKTGSSSIITGETIRNAPTINRSITDMARINPYASQAQSAGGSFDATAGISIAGQNTRFNNFQIDGASANDAFGIGGAGTAGSVANNNFVTLEAIDELKVAVSPYDVRQSGFTGGLINAVTRGGTNTMKGSIFFYGRNEALVGLSPDVNRRPFDNFYDAQMGGRLGGPIVRDKLFFHVSAETRQRSTPVEVGINDPNALNNFAVNPQVIDEVARIARDVYGFDPGATTNPYSIPNRSYNILTRLDWNISDQHKLQFRHNLLYGTQTRNLQRTSTVFGLTSQANDFTTWSNQFVTQLNSVLGDGVSNEFRATLTTTNEQRVLSTNPFPEIRVYVGSREYVTFGPERNSQANALDQTQLTLTDDVSFFLGAHTLTLGTHNEISWFNNLFIPDAYGSYQFENVQTFRDSTPNYYRLSYANTAVTGSTLLPRQPWSMMQAGLYLMDEWQVTPTLRVTGGLRVDVPVFFTNPLENPAFARQFPGLSTSQIPSTALLYSPRAGFNWDVSGDKTFQIRGGSGLFTGRAPAVWIGNQYTNTGMDLYRVEIGRSGAGQSPIIDPVTGQPARIDVSAPPPRPGDPTFPGTATSQRSAINITDKNFRFPQIWRSTLGFDYRLLPGITLTVEGMYGRNINSIDYANLNLRPSGRGVSPLDGRPMYADASRTDSLVSPDFTQVLLLRSRSEGYSYSTSAQLNVDARNTIVPGLGILLAYTHMAAYDLNASTDATASSQWGNTDAVDPNNATLGRSNYDVPHRILANVSYTIPWTSDVSTTIGIVYSGNSGRPYSLSYIQDYNGDNALGGNDLIYVPKREDYGTKVVVTQPTGTDLRTPEQVWEQIMSFVESNPVLKEYQGRILPRNALREPWLNQLDLRLTQKLPAFGTNSVEFTLDVQNLLNLIDSESGLQRYVNFQSYNIFGLTTTNGTPFDNQGRLRMTYSQPVTNGRPGIYNTDNYGSRWRMQLGVRYNF